MQCENRSGTGQRQKSHGYQENVKLEQSREAERGSGGQGHLSKQALPHTDRPCLLEPARKQESSVISSMPTVTRRLSPPRASLFTSSSFLYLPGSYLLPLSRSPELQPASSFLRPSLLRAALKLSFLTIAGPALDQQEEKWMQSMITEENEQKQVETHNDHRNLVSRCQAKLLIT